MRIRSVVAALAGPSTPSAIPVPSVDLVCLISVQHNFSPPLNFNTVTASRLGLLSDCASPNGRYPTLKSGTVFSTSDVIATGCWPAPLRMTGGQSKIFWNDGTSSTFTVRLSTDPTAGGLRLNADVTQGPLTGSHAAAIPTAVEQRGFCLLGGVRSASATFGAMPIYHWVDPTKPAKRRAHASRR